MSSLLGVVAPVLQMVLMTRGGLHVMSIKNIWLWDWPCLRGRVSLKSEYSFMRTENRTLLWGVGGCGITKSNKIDVCLDRIFGTVMVECLNESISPKLNPAHLVEERLLLLVHPSGKNYLSPSAIYQIIQNQTQKTSFSNILRIIL